MNSSTASSSSYNFKSPSSPPRSSSGVEGKQRRTETEKGTPFKMRDNPAATTASKTSEAGNASDETPSDSSSKTKHSTAPTPKNAMQEKTSKSSLPATSETDAERSETAVVSADSGVSEKTAAPEEGKKKDKETPRRKKTKDDPKSKSASVRAGLVLAMGNTRTCYKRYTKNNFGVEYVIMLTSFLELCQRSVMETAVKNAKRRYLEGYRVSVPSNRICTVLFADFMDSLKRDPIFKAVYDINSSPIPLNGPVNHGTGLVAKRFGANGDVNGKKTRSKPHHRPTEDEEEDREERNGNSTIPRSKGRPKAKVGKQQRRDSDSDGEDDHERHKTGLDPKAYKRLLGIIQKQAEEIKKRIKRRRSAPRGKTSADLELFKEDEEEDGGLDSDEEEERSANKKKKTKKTNTEEEEEEEDEDEMDASKDLQKSSPKKQKKRVKDD